MITFKKCNVTQLTLLYDIALQSYKEAYLYLWDDQGADYIAKNYSKPLWEAELKKDTANYYLVYYNEKLAGYFKLKENRVEPYGQNDCLEIEKLYFLQSFTGKGIGKNTINFIEDLARSQHKKIAWLKVMLSSPANAFYSSLGFEKVLESYLDYTHMKAEFRTIVTFVKKLDTEY